MRKRVGSLLLALGALCCALSVQSASLSSTYSLDGLDWAVSNANGSISLSTKLPAYPVNLLQKKGIIQDPLYRFGELETRWVALDTWTFETAFTPGPDVLARTNVDLDLGGVDTFATIYLNDQLVASLENFHRKYVLPVKPWLKAGPNTLRVVLHPAIPIAIDRKMKHPYWIPTITQLGNIDAYNFARKPAYDFGWDWGPGLAAAGIYGSVSLLAYDAALLRSAHIRQRRAPSGDFIIRAEPELIVPEGGDSGLLVVEMPGLGVRAEQALEFKAAGRGLAAVELLVPASKVSLWWPRGYGDQPLYDLTVSYVSTAGAPSPAVGAADPTSTIARRVGFRTVELVEKPLKDAADELLSAAGGGWAASTEPGTGTRACMGVNGCGQYGWVDGKKWTFISSPMQPDLNYPVTGFDFSGAYPNSSFPGGDNPWWNQKLGVWTGWGQPALAERVEGESMFFKVNGVPIYAKGANIIPFNTIPINATADTIRAMLGLALDSNMNMLRVWGGGWYMPDAFYDITDENGILVWQETMFACASYPRDDNFIGEVKAEVEQQIRRISWHPSVVVWGGNNEVETSLEWYRETQNNPGLFVHDYTELFVTAIGGLMGQLVPELPYLDSSPSNGMVSRKPWIKRWGGAWDPRYGDVHYYDYYADCQDFKTFPMAKFVSEHGWPSFPTWHTFKAATAPEDWEVGSAGMEFRQRHYNKTMEMLNQYGKHFRLPLTWKGASPEDTEALWRRYMYLNHVQQALCIDTGFSYWRRLRSEGRALTMGILYWQLNDVWAGASWSGIDYQGRYKPMQYRVKHQFSDFVVQTALDGGYAQVFVVSDDLSPTTATLDLSILPLAAPAGAACGAAPAGGAKAAGAPVWAKRVQVPVPALNAALVVNASLAELLKAAPGCTATTCFLRAEAASDATPTKPAQASASDLFFAQFKELDLQAPAVTASGFAQAAPDTVTFQITAGPAAALLVVLDSEIRGRFSDNMVNLAPCGSKALTFKSAGGAPVSAAQLEAALEVATLYENQEPLPGSGSGAEPFKGGAAVFKVLADAAAAAVEAKAPAAAADAKAPAAATDAKAPAADAKAPAADDAKAPAAADAKAPAAADAKAPAAADAKAPGGKLPTTAKAAAAAAKAKAEAAARAAAEAKAEAEARAREAEEEAERLGEKKYAEEARRIRAEQEREEAAERKRREEEEREAREEELKRREDQKKQEAEEEARREREAAAEKKEKEAAAAAAKAAGDGGAAAGDGSKAAGRRKKAKDHPAACTATSCPAKLEKDPEGGRGGMKH